jgi:hypothetical protein
MPFTPEGPSDASELPLTAAELFRLLWDTLVDVLGQAATASLLRRSIRRAAERRPDLGLLKVERLGFEYAYATPAEWGKPGQALPTLRELAGELSPLLVELTGPVIVRRLNAIPDLQRCQIRFEERTR